MAVQPGFPQSVRIAINLRKFKSCELLYFIIELKFLSSTAWWSVLLLKEQKIFYIKVPKYYCKYKYTTKVPFREVMFHLFCKIYKDILDFRYNR